MSAPLVWILFPFLVALLLFGLRKRRKVSVIIGTGLCLFFAALALVTPINQVIKSGPIQFSLPGELSVLGRIFTLTQQDMPIIAFLFTIGALWFFLSWENRRQSLFISVGLSIIALLIAALAVKPFIYGALLIEVAILACILLLSDQRKPAGNATMRFLVFQTLGMPFLLLAGWFLASGEITPINETQLTLSVVLLGLGFAFWMGAFPLHTWIPMIAEEAEPRISGFIFSILPLPVMFFLLDFLNSYAWLREFPAIYPAFRWFGAIMVLFGGVWALFQRNIKQVFGYLVMALSGLSLLALGVKGAQGIQILTYSFLPRFLSIALMSIFINVLLKNKSELKIDHLRGLVWNAPFSALGIVIAIFSSAGMPLLAGFPILQGLQAELYKLSYLALAMMLGGLFCIFLTGFKLLTIMFSKPDDFTEMKETLRDKLTIGLLVIFILVVGLMPAVFNSFLSSLAGKFPFLLQ
jgi:NADH-quinone oxidoreductase subunit N